MSRTPPNTRLKVAARGPEDVEAYLASLPDDAKTAPEGPQGHQSGCARRRGGLQLRGSGIQTRRTAARALRGTEGALQPLPHELCGDTRTCQGSQGIQYLEGHDTVRRRKPPAIAPGAEAGSGADR